VLKVNVGADEPQRPQGLRKIPEKKSPNALSATERGGGREPEHCAPDVTRGSMEHASLNTGANCFT
jgi:uncharacterized membrane protein